MNVTAARGQVSGSMNCGRVKRCRQQFNAWRRRVRGYGLWGVPLGLFPLGLFSLDLQKAARVIYSSWPADEYCLTSINIICLFVPLSISLAPSSHGLSGLYKVLNLALPNRSIERLFLQFLNPANGLKYTESCKIVVQTPVSTKTLIFCEQRAGTVNSQRVWK